MGIKSYVNNGKEYFVVAIRERSRKNPRIRVQRKRSGIESREEAELIYKVMVRDVAYTIAQREGHGDSWRGLIQSWNYFHEKYPTGQYSESTRRDYVAKLMNWTEPWMNRLAIEITSGDALNAFLWMYERGASYKLRTDVKSAISVVYKWAIDQRMLLGKASPVAGLQVPRYSGEERGEKIPLIKTRDEMAKALDTARELEHPWHPVWFVAVHTGLRAGELNALRKDRIDLLSKDKAMELDRGLDKGTIKPRDADYGRIYVDRAWNKHAGKNLNTKGQYWRVIPVNRSLYWFLAEYLPKANWGKDECGERVFQRFTMWDKGSQAAVIRSFFEQHGFGEMTFHTMRAVWATQMLKSGVDSTTVMKVGGWKDMETMMIYVRLAGIDVAGATGGLDFAAPQGVGQKEASNGNVVQLFKR